jgi:uncharacterized protein (DUF2147 family)
MKLVVIPTLALAICSVSAADAAVPSSLTGLWLPAGGSTVELAPCGGETLCGKLVSSPTISSDWAAAARKNKNPALRTRRLSGLMILVGLKKVGSVWSGGKIYNPDDGKTYSASIEQLPDNSLGVTGCTSVIGVSFCGLQQWKRAN